MFITLFKTFLMPPAVQLLLMLLAFVLWKRRIFLSRLLMLTAWGSLVALSLPIVSHKLFIWLEQPYFDTSQVVNGVEALEPKAVVVLGGGRIRNTPEYGGDEVSEGALWRLRYGAVLAKQYDLPMIVSGGTVYPYELKTEAQMAARVLEDELGVNTVWQEGNSRDTWQNAKQTSALLLSQFDQNEPVVLVTHAYHMRRAQYAFEQAGVTVIPAATGFKSLKASGWVNDWLPQSTALDDSRVALHEYLGLVFYFLR